MTRGFTLSISRLRLVSALAAALLVAGLGLAVVPAAEAADVPCVGDSCDDGAWLAARGVANDVSFWGMSAGHNCTNYVAWRLISAGVERPPTHPGNAADWAANAITDGFLVDDMPAVGAVAQWDAFKGGYGEDGHVAYVERIEDDGTILVSEDYWRGGAQLGPLTYRVVDAASISHFIHYLEPTDRFRTASLSAMGWTSSATSLDIAPVAMSATALAGGAEVYYTEGGKLWQIARSAIGWTASDTGVRSTATTLSAVSMDGLRPYVMSLDDGALLMSVRTVSGWQRMSTGFAIRGDIAAVDLGGLWPTVYLSQDGELWELWGDNDGWHSRPTGVEVWGEIAAIVDPAGLPVVFNVRNGMLFRSWLDAEGWHTESTGVAATGTISATQTATGSQVFLVQDDAVSLITTDGLTWTATTTGLEAGAVTAVVDLGTDAPLFVQTGSWVDRIGVRSPSVG